MPARTRSDLPEAELRIIDETENAFTIGIEIPKAAIARHKRFLEMLIEAVKGGDDV